MKSVLTVAVAVVCLAPNLAFTQPVETEIPGVTAEVIELRQSGGVLRLAVRFTNSGVKTAEPSRFSAERIVLVDVKSKKKYFPLKDANGQYLAGPIGDWIDGGRIRLIVPAGQPNVLWAYFEPVAAGTALNVELPLMFPFEQVPVTEGPGKIFTAGSARSTPGGGVATLVSARRADQTLTVRLRLEAERGAKPELGGSYFIFGNVVLFDSAGKRKYPLLKDTEGYFQAQPLAVKMDGGSFIYNWSKVTLVSLTFQAPPDTVKVADLLLPRFLPFEGVALEGAGGAAAGGVAAAGKTLGLEGALKALDADVTPTEIKIDLSADVLFDLDQADLKPAAEERLNHLLTVVNSKPESRIAIEGHTDVRGEAPYNQALSERRARSVQAWLVAHGAAAGRISATGAGESRPIRTGSAETDHQANRRVEIRIRG